MLLTPGQHATVGQLVGAGGRSASPRRAWGLRRGTHRDAADGQSLHRPPGRQQTVFPRRRSNACLGAAGSLGVKALASLAIGERARVQAVVGDDETSLRLLEMGLTPGVEVVVVGTAAAGRSVGTRIAGLSLERSTQRGGPRADRTLVRRFRAASWPGIRSAHSSGSCESRWLITASRSHWSETPTPASPRCSRRGSRAMRQRVGNFPGVTVGRRKNRHACGWVHSPAI